MRYYFTDNCYFDSDDINVYRNGSIVSITPTQKKILQKLTSQNGEMVSHEELYVYAWNSEPIADYKASISNQFNRNRPSEKGLLIRVPELAEYFSSSKSQIGGGYCISIPRENIRGKERGSTYSREKSYWYTNTDFADIARESVEIDDYRISRLMRNFLKGGRCTWPLLFSNSDNKPVHRDILRKIKESINSDNNAIALTAAGGEGKSTILMQLCADLYNDNHKVYYHAPNKTYELPEISSDAIILIDNPSNSREFKQLLSKLVAEGITVIIALRSNEWSYLSESLYEDTKLDIGADSIMESCNIYSSGLNNKIIIGSKYIDSCFIYNNILSFSRSMFRI